MPGIMGAIRRVTDGRVMDALSRWRQRGGVDVSPMMRERILAAVPAALRDLRVRAQARAVHEAVCARLREFLWQVEHAGRSVPMTVTLREVAERAGIPYQTLINFRTSERPMSAARMKKLKAAMREVGLLPLGLPPVQPLQPVPPARPLPPRRRSPPRPRCCSPATAAPGAR